ncbi:MAG: alpha/beta hydrolase [Azonexus sp.]|jgi:alpha-beta hydrolase superfamily lysophospholipase|nr:alpha/beta hydrolase [Betaproteobacteria bacterium]MBK8919515.1 alpha/beta hydrolase [Betaproteobacteria bacterium]MBP6036283.1 alpha/beta hydrolase [Azonexus sp.]MBP6906853.1 alpha/beta hydrolase [Azonexus sp.]
MINILRRAIVILLLAYVGLVTWFWWNQENIIFRGEPLPAAHDFRLPKDVEELSIPVAEGTLSALNLRLPRPRGVVFFLHGNGGNLDSWFSNHDFYRQANLDLFMIDYRGYGKSGGKVADEAQFLADVRAAWAVLAARYPETPRIIHGRSLGSGPAAILAAEVQPALTVLVSPYCSLGELASTAYPFLPGFVVRYPFDGCSAAGSIRGPLLLLHGDADTLIPPAHSALIKARAPNAEVVILPGAGHDDVHLADTYGPTLRARLDRVGCGAGSALACR